ncbi:hypothetical protein ILYODFUR_030095 [Ilyodon furcidens]|uniref:Uncharacterized protein n=1 Tax=Ilyodon furcidens TaxID=33524 RepID=A0ABV0UYS6_9TELE
MLPSSSRKVPRQLSFTPLIFPKLCCRFTATSVVSTSLLAVPPPLTLTFQHPAHRTEPGYSPGTKRCTQVVKEVLMLQKMLEVPCSFFRA